MPADKSYREMEDSALLSPETRKKQTARRKLLTAMGFCLAFMVAEVVGGYLSGSLAIMTDAAHLLSDVAGLLISVFSVWLSERKPSQRLTFGYHRFEIIGAVASVLLIWLLTGILVYEAIQRIITPEEVDGVIMFITATAGLLVNLAMMKILHQGHGHSHGGGHSHASHTPTPASSRAATPSASHGHSHGGHGHDDHGHDDHGHDDHGHSHGGHDHGHGGHSAEDRDDHGHGGHGGHGSHDDGDSMGVRAAFIHVVGDLIQSIGVMIAAALIWWKPELRIADPICTFIFSILVLFTTINIMSNAFRILLDFVPDHIDHGHVLAQLHSVPNVVSIHDLHIWSIAPSMPSLSVHILARDDPSDVLRAAQKVCAQVGITHTTIQVERIGTVDEMHCNTNPVCELPEAELMTGRVVRSLPSPVRRRMDPVSSGGDSNL